MDKWRNCRFLESLLHLLTSSSFWDTPNTPNKYFGYETCCSLGMEQHLLWKHQSRGQPPSNTSAVDCRGVLKILVCEMKQVRKEPLILIVLCNQTMLPWPNQSCSGSRGHFAWSCTCIYFEWLLSILWPSSPSAGSWLWQPAHQSRCLEDADEWKQDHCRAHVGVQSCLL